MFVHVPMHQKFLEALLSRYLKLIAPKKQLYTQKYGTLRERTKRISSGDRLEEDDKIIEQWSPLFGGVSEGVLYCMNICRTGESMPIKVVELCNALMETPIFSGKSNTIVLLLYYCVFSQALLETSYSLRDSDIPAVICDKLRALKSQQQQQPQVCNRGTQTHSSVERTSPGIKKKKQQQNNTERENGELCNDFLRLQLVIEPLKYQYIGSCGQTDGKIHPRSRYITNLLAVLYHNVYSQSPEYGECFKNFRMFSRFVFRRGDITRYVFGSDEILGDKAKYELARWVDYHSKVFTDEFTAKINDLAEVLNTMAFKQNYPKKYDPSLVMHYAARLFPHLVENNEKHGGAGDIKWVEGIFDPAEKLLQVPDASMGLNLSWDIYSLEQTPLPEYINECSPQRLIVIESYLWLVGDASNASSYSILRVVPKSRPFSLIDLGLMLFKLRGRFPTLPLDSRVQVVGKSKLLCRTTFVHTLQYLLMCSAVSSGRSTYTEVLSAPYLCSELCKFWSQPAFSHELYVHKSSDLADGINEEPARHVKMHWPTSTPESETYPQEKFQGFFQVMCSWVRGVCVPPAECVYVPEFHECIQIWASVIYAPSEHLGSVPRISFSDVFAQFSEAVLHDSSKGPLVKWESVLYYNEPHSLVINYAGTRKSYLENALDIIPPMCFQEILALNQITEGELREMIGSKKKRGRKSRNSSTTTNGSTEDPPGVIVLKLGNDHCKILLSIIAGFIRDHIPPINNPYRMLFDWIRLDRSQILGVESRLLNDFSMVLSAYINPRPTACVPSAMKAAYFSGLDGSTTCSMPDGRVAVVSMQKIDPQRVGDLAQIGTIPESPGGYCIDGQTDVKAIPAEYTTLFKVSDVIAMEQYKLLFYSMMLLERYRSIGSRNCNISERLGELRGVEINMVTYLSNGYILQYSQLGEHLCPNTSIFAEFSDAASELAASGEFSRFIPNPANSPTDFSGARVAHRIPKYVNSPDPRSRTLWQAFEFLISESNSAYEWLCRMSNPSRQLQTTSADFAMLKQRYHRKSAKVSLWDSADLSAGLSQSRKHSLDLPFLGGGTYSHKVQLATALRQLLSQYNSQLHLMTEHRLSQARIRPPEQMLEFACSAQTYSALRLSEFTRIRAEVDALRKSAESPQGPGAGTVRLDPIQRQSLEDEISKLYTSSQAWEDGQISKLFGIPRDSMDRSNALFAGKTQQQQQQEVPVRLASLTAVPMLYITGAGFDSKGNLV